MLLFLDESYEKEAGGGFCHAYAGFAVDERKYRGLAAAVYQCRQRHLLHSSGLTDEQRYEAAKTHLVVEEPVERAELKSTKLLSARQVKRYAEHGSAPGLQMAGELLDALADIEATVLGVLSYPVNVSEIQGVKTHLPVQFVRLFERVELWMQEQYPDQMVIVIPDTIHSGINQNLSERIADFLFRSNQGQRMRHIVVNPFWVDSCTTVGSQLADLIAHILMNTMRPTTTQKPLYELWRKVAAMEFRSIDTETRGIRKMKRPK